MKIVKNVFDRLVKRLRAEKRAGTPRERKKSGGMLNERISSVERKTNSHKLTKSTLPSDLFIEMDMLLQDEIKSREKLERKLTKTSRKIDHLAAEFVVLQCQLKTSTIDLDLEKRKNAELRKRLHEHPIMEGRTQRNVD